MSLKNICMVCPKCNKKHDGTWKVCMSCGVKLIENSKITPQIISEEEKRHASMIVTTGDLKKEYEIISPIFYQLSN